MFLNYIFECKYFIIKQLDKAMMCLESEYCGSTACIGFIRFEDGIFY